MHYHKMTNESSKSWTCSAIYSQGTRSKCWPQWSKLHIYGKMQTLKHNKFDCWISNHV